MGEPIGLFPKSKVSVGVVLTRTDGSVQTGHEIEGEVGRIRTALFRFRMWLRDQLQKRRKP